MKYYIAGLILFEGVYGVVELVLHIGQDLVDIEVGWFGLIFLMVQRMVSDTAWTQWHQAILLVNLWLLSLQKLVMLSQG